MKAAQPTSKKNAGPWIDIDLAALCANYALIRALAPAAETAAVVKCDAYGLGAKPVATALAEREGCRTFFVAYPEEGAATFPESNPLRRTGDEQDVAEACVYLAASSGKFVTGEVITVDGGQQLWGDPWPGGRPAEFELDYGKSR